MEEQNKNKEIKLGTVKNENTQDNNKKQEYTYEELKDIANKLFQENRYFRQQLQQAQEAFNTFDRLGYLFKVVELSKVEGRFKFHDDFVIKCMEEIEKIMTPPVDEKPEDSKKN
jgi:hypothetical protein